MSSTSLCSAGSEGEGEVEEDGVSVGDGGGGSDDDAVDVVASAVAVASARMHPKGLLRAEETLCVALRCISDVGTEREKKTWV